MAFDEKETSAFERRRLGEGETCRRGVEYSTIGDRLASCGLHGRRGVQDRRPSFGVTGDLGGNAGVFTTWGRVPPLGKA